MQVKNYYNTVERSLFYATGMYHEGLEAGDEYIIAPKAISIWITTYDVFDEGPFHERALLRRDFENRVLTDKFAIHYIQLPKFKKQCKKISSKLDEWLTFIINENQEEISMIDNENIKKAEKELENLNGDEETRKLAELRERTIRDELAAIAQFKREGREEGLAEGRKEGKQEGSTEEKIKIAKKLLLKKLDIDTIIEVTGLTKEEIEKI